MIDFGLTESERREFMLLGTSPEIRNPLLSRILPLMGEESEFTAVRSQISEDHERPDFISSLHELPECDWGEWIFSLRAATQETHGMPCCFCENAMSAIREVERQLVHTAFLSIPWLHSSNDDSVSTEHLIELTPRQRTVMFMLLDGFRVSRLQYHWESPATRSAITSRQFTRISK